MTRTPARAAFLIALALLSSTDAYSQQAGGAVSGTIVLEGTNEAMHAVRVILSPTGRSVDTDDKGAFEFRNVPPGSYQLIPHSPGLFADRQAVQIAAGTAVRVDFKMRLAPIRETVTVTATGQEQATVDAIQSVLVLDQTQLSLRSAASLGEVLQHEPGVAKRSSGPGSSRPVVRGFDGDRVLILEDGIRTGTLSSQSGDHGEPMDVSKLERLEVVRGPATLLYGSNAVGGVVNAISRHDILHQHVDAGVRGYLTGVGGSNNALGGGSAGFELGSRHWKFWGSGGGQRTSGYDTPIGEIRNTHTRLGQTNAGAGHYGDRGFITFNYGFTDSRYGIPVDPREEEPEIADLLLRRHSYRLSTGWTNVGMFENVQARINYSDYNHQEIVGGEPETTLFNKQVIYRTVFEQKPFERLRGSFGFWGMHRDFKAQGEESLAPPTTQDGFAVFGLETLTIGNGRIEFGGRIENNRYKPVGLEKRSFTGFSGAIGLSQRLWENSAFVVNYSRSYRAPALEELYNNGPHPGNLTFEIGNPNLRSEKNNGLDLSLRHQSSRVRGELNFFYYNIDRFVYLAPTGNIEDGLVEAEYGQADSRFIGSEARVDVGLHRNLWMNLAADVVNAKLKESNVFLPRIPPVRGRIGFDARFGGLSIRPEVVLASAQRKVFITETPTAGYSVFNLSGSYTIARSHYLHQFSAELFNANDRLYRNHLSFVKEFAPEIGRGVRFSYTIQIL